MQPCSVCGGVGVDAAGYCVQCRTYLGPPGQSPIQYPPVTAYGPTSAQPYPGPSSSPPFAGPSSAPPMDGAGYGQVPGYPGGAFLTPTSTPPSSYPPAYPPAAPRSRSPLVIPLIALSGVLVIVVLAIVAVVVIRNRDNGGGGGSGGGGDRTPQASASTSLVDRCVVGNWTVTSYAEDVAVASVGKVHFTGTGRGADLRLSADGKGIQDYGDGTTFTATVPVDGQNVEVSLVISGTIKYDFRTNDNTMSFSNVVADGTTVIGAANSEGQTADLVGSSDPAKYTCSGDVLTTYTSLYRAEMHRTS